MQYLLLNRGVSDEIKEAITYLQAYSETPAERGGGYLVLTLSSLGRDANEGFEGEFIALFNDEYLARSGLVSGTADVDQEKLHRHAVRLMLTVKGRTLDNAARHVDLVDSSGEHVSHRRLPIIDAQTTASYITEFLFSGESSMADDLPVVHRCHRVRARGQADFLRQALRERAEGPHCGGRRAGESARRCARTDNLRSGNESLFLVERRSDDW
jgi:hypothetical protein